MHIFFHSIHFPWTFWRLLRHCNELNGHFPTQFLFITVACSLTNLKSFHLYWPYYDLNLKYYLTKLTRKVRERKGRWVRRDGGREGRTITFLKFYLNYALLKNSNLKNRILYENFAFNSICHGIILWSTS